jgi:hypothetical protein
MALSSPRQRKIIVLVSCPKDSLPTINGEEPYYFIYQDDRIKNNYIRTRKERYDSINEVFPNIHNRVPQHMIASYLGITPIHLSRLKKADLDKV